MAKNNLQLDINKPLELRIEEFKSNPENVKAVNDFLEELFEKAENEAFLRKNCCKRPKDKSDGLQFQNGTKRLGAWSNRARTSARTFASRLFTTICNCTNSVKNVVVNRNNS